MSKAKRGCAAGWISGISRDKGKADTCYRRIPGVFSDEGIHSLVSDFKGISWHACEFPRLRLQVAPGNGNLLCSDVTRDTDDLDTQHKSTKPAKEMTANAQDDSTRDVVQHQVCNG